MLGGLLINYNTFSSPCLPFKEETSSVILGGLPSTMLIEQSPQLEGKNPRSEGALYKCVGNASRCFRAFS